MQRTLKVLQGIVAEVADYGTREKLQSQMSSTNEILLLRLDELSTLNHLLQVEIRRTHSKMPGEYPSVMKAKMLKA